jgi:hypothetical protein
MESAEMRAGTGTAVQQTPFGRATDPAAPQLPEEEQRPLSDWEMDELEDQTVRDPSYIPTFNEWDSWDQKRAARSNAVNGFFQGAGSIASAIGGVVWSLGKLPGDFVFRGFGPAYDTMVHSLAEGARRSGVGLAEIINYAGDVYADSSSDIRRSAAINDKIRQQLAAENKFTGNAQQDEAILEQAFHEARAAGLYDRTLEETAAQAQEDRKTAYDRFVRNRALEQEFLGIDNFTMGNDPIETGRIFGPKTVGGQPSQITAESVTKRAYGIDDSKVDEGLATFGMLALDPLAILPMGAGGLSKLRALRRISILADKPLGGVAKSAGWAATKAENLQDRLMRAGLTSDRLAKASFGVAVGSGALGFSQNNDVAKGIALAAAVLPAVRKSGGILRGVESAAQSGQMVVKEMGVGGVGVFRADSASRLADDAAIPGRYREAMRGFFSGPESSLKRASQNEGMSLRARRTLGALDNTGVTQAFRLADDAVSGGLAGAAVASPFALIAPEDQQSQIFGAIATMGAAGGLIGGPLARRTQMIDADIARMLADVDAAGGDAAYFSQLPHETLARYAAMQGVVSTKVDWVPLSAQDYAANLAMPAASRETTKGLFVDASDGNRPRIFLDIDQLASGDVAGHEIGHAILKSDILGGEIKNNMRNQVNVQYGQDGVQARGREYLASIMAREVEAGVTGIKPEVLTDAEMQRVANGASPEDIVRARWEDPQMRQRMIDERIEDKNQRDLAEGNMEWDWARDEIAAETFSGLSGGIDFRRMREGGPLAGMLGAASGLFDMMGAKFRGNGRLETPNRVFEENPLFDTPEMRRAVTNYTKQFERYLVGMERDSAPKKRGTKVAPTGKASEAARSPHNRVYQNGAVVENDIFILDANGNPMPKSQQQVNTQEKARAATLKSINTRTRLVPVHSAEWGARKVGNRVEVGGPNLPLQFDNFVQVPQWLRTKAREFEAGRRTGQSYRVSYNAIGTGASGSYKVSNLGNVEAIAREVVPFGWQLSDKNHLLAKVIDLDAFRAAAIRAVDRGELPEFNNNVKDVEAGLKVLLKNHEDGVPGETNLGAQKKNLLNGLLGTGTPTQKAANPLYGDLNPKGSIRTFRFDRLNYADPFGTGYFPHYHKINTNALPREVGVMSLDEWRQFDADRKSAYLNQQAARRGYSNSTNWQGADAAGFRAADAEYRREFPVPNERPAEGAALPRDAKRSASAAYSERADIPLNERARRAAFVGADGRVVSTNKRTHFETNEDLGPDFLAIGAGSIGEDGFFRFGSQTMDDAMGESPRESLAAAARHNQALYRSGQRPSALLEDPPGLEQMGGPTDQQTLIQRDPAGQYEPLGMLRKGANGKWQVFTSPMVSVDKDGRQVVLPPTKVAEYATEAQARTRAEKEFFSGLSLQDAKQYLGPREQKAITEAQKRIAEVARNNPEAARLEVTRDDRGLPKVGLIEDSDGNPVLDARGNQMFGAIYKGEKYGLREAPGLSKDEARAVQQAADLMEADARRGQQNPAIAKGIGWYGRMRSWLQNAYGATIERFGQLLGATSARTPVDMNFIQAREALQMFGRGAYDDLLKRFDAFVMQKKADADSGKMEADWRKKGGKGAFKLEDEYRKQVNSFKEVPLRANGKKYNANSTKVLHALYGNWIAQTKGPKTPNFAGNLTGRTFKATIDVWAARNLRRLLYQGKKARWRILPEQEQGVTDADFFFSQKVYDEVGRRMGVPTDDLQALQWFNEKDVWEVNGWTDKTGAEKSSFDKEAGKLNVDRYQVGLTTFTTPEQFDPAVQRSEMNTFRESVRGLDGLEAARITESEGLYGDVVEPSFDVEFSVNRRGDVSPSIEPVMRSAIETAQRNNQKDVIISLVVDELHPNARPMVEVGFKSAATKAQVDAVTAAFRANGIDGFTIARNERGDALGVRSQYVPEISARYDTLDHLNPDQFAINSGQWVDKARRAIANLENQDNVSYRKEGYVSTAVYGIEEYTTATPADLRGSNAKQELGRRRAILAAGTR